MATYRFEDTFFRNYLWIRNGELFVWPQRMDIETETPGAFRLEVTHPGGRVELSHTFTNERAGWHGLDLAGLGVHRGPYKFRFANASSGVRRIKQGDLHTR